MFAGQFNFRKDSSVECPRRLGGVSPSTLWVECPQRLSWSVPNDSNDFRAVECPQRLPVECPQRLPSGVSPTTSIGCWHLCGWLYAMVEVECWDEPMDQLVDRSDRPWDNPERRPSHRDRRRRIAREMLRESFLSDLPAGTDESKMRQRFEQLLAIAA